MRYQGFLQTGQTSCSDTGGRAVDCHGSGQDAEFATGIPWPTPRFEIEGETVEDQLTGLVWTIDANPAEFPLDWQAANDFISGINRRQLHGFHDWRLPNRRELRSLIGHETRNPALPGGHPFKNVFPGWYWTSTAAAIDPAYAWYIHMEGGRSFYGAKSQYYLVWPVRGEGNRVLPATGQSGDSPYGKTWPEPRFEIVGGNDIVFDRLTGLRWLRTANLTGEPVLWEEALAAVKKPVVRQERQTAVSEPGSWRLPNINELESLVDMSRHDPALPAGHPFVGCKEVCWSSTTSMFEPNWAWALYLHKGAIGVGRKDFARFHVWAVNGGR